MSEFAVLEVPLEFSDEYLPSFSPLRAALCEICGDGGYEEAQVMCENTGDDGSGCPGVRHLHCFEPPKGCAEEAERWYCNFCTKHHIKGGFKPPRKRKLASAEATAEDIAEDAMEESEDRSEDGSEEDEADDMPLSQLILMPPTTLTRSQQTVLRMSKPAPEISVGKMGGQATASISKDEPQLVQTAGNSDVSCITGVVNGLKQGLRKDEGTVRGQGASKIRKVSPPEGIKVESSGNSAEGSAPSAPSVATTKAAEATATKSVVEPAQKAPRVVAPGRRPVSLLSKTAASKPTASSTDGARLLALRRAGAITAAAAARPVATVVLGARLAAAAAAAATAVVAVAAPQQAPDPDVTLQRLNIFKQEMRGVSLTEVSELSKKEESMKLPHEAMRINDHKGRCLWQGVIRLLWSESDVGSTAFTVEQRIISVVKMEAFAVYNCPFSEEAALKLPEVLEATVISASEAEVNLYEACQYAALILGPSTLDAMSHSRMEDLARNLGDNSILRVELPSKRAWLAIVPDEGERANSFWGVFVRNENSQEVSQPHTDVPKHKHTNPRPDQSILRKGNTGARNLRICWPDAKVTDGPAEHHRQLELPPGPAYIDAPKSEQLERAMKAAVENKVSRDALVARVQAAKTAVNSAAVGGLMRMTEGGNLGWGAAGDHVVLPAPGRWDVPALPSDSAAYSKSSKGGSSWGGSRGGGAGAGVFPNGNEDKPSGEVPGPLSDIRFTMVGYRMDRDRAQEHYQAVDAVLSLGAQLYRWPTSPAQVNAIILHESVASAGFENANMHNDLALNEFLSKECQFFVGLEYLRLAAALGRPPSLHERRNVNELLPCGVTVITDAETAFQNPQGIHQLIKALQRGKDGCLRTGEWCLKMSVPERDRLVRLYDGGPSGSGRPALHCFDRYNVRTYDHGSGRGVTALLNPDECSSNDRPEPPQVVRDAVKVGFKHQKDCRHVVLAVDSSTIRHSAVNQRTLHSRTLLDAVQLVSEIVSHLDKSGKH